MWMGKSRLKFEIQKLPNRFSLLFLSMLIVGNLLSQEIKTVQIGDQVWMSANLNIKTKDSYCYKNLAENCKIFGRLYSWEKALRVCPTGFRLPTDEDWITLADSIGGMDVAGFKLMMGGETKFNVLLAGNYNKTSNIFSYQYRHAYFWTATPFSKTAAWMRQFSPEQANINRSTVKKHYYFSVRCIKE